MPRDLSTQILVRQQNKDIASSQYTRNPYGATGSYSAANAVNRLQTNIVGNPTVTFPPILGGGDTSSNNGNTSASNKSTNVHANNLSDLANSVANKAVGMAQSAVTNAVSNVVSNAMGKVNSAISGLNNAGAGLADGIQGVLGKATDFLNNTSDIFSNLGGQIDVEKAKYTQKVYNPRSLDDGAINHRNFTLTLSSENTPPIGIFGPGSFGKNEIAGNNATASASDAAEESGPLQITSNQQITTQIMSPFLWTGGENWCGITYGMLSGTRTISQKLANGQSVALGCIAQDASVIEPLLDPGAVCIKGFGNNYIHWESADRLHIKVKSSKNANDFAYDKGGQKTSVEPKSTPNGSNMFITLDGHEETLTISVTGTEEQKTSTIVITGTTITCTTTDFIVNAEKNITMTAGENISMSAGKDVSTDAQENISASAGKAADTTAGESVQIEAGSTGSAGLGGIINIGTPEGAISLKNGIMSQDMSFIRHNFPVDMIDKVKSGIDKIKNFKSTLKDMAMGQLKDLAGQGLNQVMSAASDGIGAIQNGIGAAQNAINSAQSAVQGAIGGVQNAIGSAVQGATSSITGSITGAVQDAIGGAIGSATNAIGNISNSVQNAVGGMISNAANTVNTTVNNAIGSVTQAGTQAIQSAVNVATTAATQNIQNLIPQVKINSLSYIINSFESRGYPIHTTDEDNTYEPLSAGAIEILDGTAELLNEIVDVNTEVFDQTKESVSITTDAINSAVASYDMLTAFIYTAKSIIERAEQGLSDEEATTIMANLQSMANVIDTNFNNTLNQLNTANKTLDKANNKLTDIEDVVNESAELIFDMNNDLNNAADELAKDKAEEEAKLAEQATILSESQQINYDKIDEAAQRVIDYHSNNN